MKKGVKRLDGFGIAIYIFLGIIAVLSIFPFYSTFLASISTQKEFARNPLMFFPKEVTFSAYEYLLNGTNLLSGYLNTFLLLLFGLPLSMIVSVSTGYAMSRPNYRGKKLYVFIILFTMYFSGGLIPLYLLMKTLHLTNRLFGIILLGSGNTFYAILIRNYFKTIPYELEESAKIDGAGDFTIFFKIILPLTIPIMATVLLFFAVDKWNEWFNVMLMIRDSSKWTIQVILRNIVFTTLDDMSSRMVSVEKTYYSLSLKMAAIVLTMTPVMIVYPFMQKFFMKGMIIGAVKG